MRKKISLILVVAAIVMSAAFVGAGVTLVDDRTASVAMGDHQRTTPPSVDREKGMATGRILGQDYAFRVPSQEQITQVGEQALAFLPPEARLTAAGLGTISQWLADAMQAFSQWMAGN